MLKRILEESKDATYILSTASAKQRSKTIADISRLIINHKIQILDANFKDMKMAIENGVSLPMQDRLLLNEDRILALANDVDLISKQQDPLGEIVEGKTLSNGLRYVKTLVPLGVIGLIYESRPNVTIDSASLCIRSGNVVILRGGRESINTNKKLVSIVHEALSLNNLPTSSVTLLDDPDRTKILGLIQAKGYVDLIIPRGGEKLINFVSENAHVPVIKHYKGICATFIDESASLETALKIIRNAKMSRPSACNALETLIVHRKLADVFLPILKKDFIGVNFKGCEETCRIINIDSAEGYWDKEYLANEMNIKVVGSTQEAVAHINSYGSGHSDAIITNNYYNAEEFLNKVDSACVYVNASTRFTDGGEFGYGAEIGISTDKIHSRGPMGAFDLTSTKYKIYGTGQVR